MHLSLKKGFKKQQKKDRRETADAQHLQSSDNNINLITNCK